MSTGGLSRARLARMHDPGEEMVAILMTQSAWTSPSPPGVCLDFWSSAYPAIDD
jgi:hypothetical protein